MRIRISFVLAIASLISRVEASPNQRLAELDAFCDPYYVSEQTARLTTPQWVGGVGRRRRATETSGSGATATTERYGRSTYPVEEMRPDATTRGSISPCRTPSQGKSTNCESEPPRCVRRLRARGLGMTRKP